jgi:hypothetical protein
MDWVSILGTDLVTYRIVNRKTGEVIYRTSPLPVDRINGEYENCQAMADGFYGPMVVTKGNDDE